MLSPKLSLRLFVLACLSAVATACPAPECYSDLDCPEAQMCGANDECVARVGGDNGSDAGTGLDAGTPDAN